MSDPTLQSSSLIVWRFTDGKPGHENQSLGLVEALRSMRSVACHDIDARDGVWWRLLLRGVNALDLPKPQLIMGAGHGTHRAVLAARWRTGAKAVVLMKPSLPIGLFDLCIVPEHDGVRERDNVFQVRGVLNRVKPSADHDSLRGLILIGGPSKHVGWDDATVVDRVVKIVTGRPEAQWNLTTSRRTPDSFLSVLSRHKLGNLIVTPCENTDRSWIPNQMARAGQIWVTSDSVSMVYEALTSGAAVGLISLLCPHPKSRVAIGLRTLSTDGLVTRFTNAAARVPLAPPNSSFNEAERCAREIVARWF